MTESYALSARGIALQVSAIGGMLCDLTINDAGAIIRPLHKAPWVDQGDPSLAEAPPHLARLEGDFFCAPFAGDVDGSDTPAHGWPANGHWRAVSIETLGHGIVGHFRLDERVHGAVVDKRITLLDGSPVVYQTHVLTGGTGRIPLAHHAMIRVPDGARLSFSPKAFGATPELSLEAGTDSRSLLAYPQRFSDLSAVSLAEGGTVDATFYPFAKGHEDFLTLVERAGAQLGWSAAVTQDFVFFAVKDARVLPQTILWMSNGGRRYAPWNGRHDHVLGLEEACSFFASGAETSAAPNGLSVLGVPTAVDLIADGAVTVRYALGAIVRPVGFSRIGGIEIGNGEAVLIDISGVRRAVPFASQFFDNQ